MWECFCFFAQSRISFICAFYHNKLYLWSRINVLSFPLFRLYASWWVISHLLKWLKRLIKHPFCCVYSTSWSHTFIKLRNLHPHPTAHPSLCRFVLLLSLLCHAALTCSSSETTKKLMRAGVKGGGWEHRWVRQDEIEDGRRNQAAEKERERALRQIIAH